MSNKVTSSLGRQGTTTKSGNYNKDAVINSVGFNTNVNVNNPIRELTKHGIETSHITGKTQGPGRQIYDKSFFQNLFKQKLNDINKEINNLKGEVETINKEVNEYYNLNKTYETLSKEVQNLEGELADYNLAGDKYRSNMRSEDIDAVYQHFKMSNKRKRDESDDRFLMKSKKEEELSSVDYEINQIMQKLEQKLMELEPDQQQEYEQLREENMVLVKQIHELRDEMTRLNVDISEGEKLLKNNPNKKEAHKLKDQIIQLNRRKEQLQLQLNDSGLSIEEWKEKLVKQYKEDSEEKTTIDKKINEVKKIIETYKKSIVDLEKEFESHSSNTIENSKAQDSIMQKDKEYTKFIENFEDIKRGNLKELEQKEEIIYCMLEAQTNKLTNKDTSKNESNELKSELEYKKNLVKKSASTLEEAKAQYESLLVKHKRLGDLETTLKKDISNYQEKIEKCKMDMADKFERVDYQKNFYKNETSKMQDLLAFLEKNKNSYKTLLEATKWKCKSKGTQLEELDTYKKLREMEKKMQENENYIFSLTTYIDSKEKESDYSQIMDECLNLQQEINAEIIKKTLSVKI